MATVARRTNRERHEAKQKQRVILCDIHDPVLIIPAPTGILYCNQVDGCAVRWKELEGYLVPMPPQGRHIAFDKHAWYREKQHRLPPPAQWYRNSRKNDLIMYGEPSVERELLRARKEACVWWMRVCEDIEWWAEKHHLQLKVVKRGVPQYEAWLTVKYRNTLRDINGWLTGVLTWENCD